MSIFRRWYKRRCRAPVFALMARLGRSAVEFHENRNYDMASNGELRVLRRLAREDPQVVFDVGANVGDWSRLALALFPNARVHAFEAVEATFGALVQETAGVGRLQANPFGLSDREGSARFHYYPDFSGQSSLHPYEHRGRRMEEIEVRLTTGDAYCRAHGVERIDLLKIDVEGEELAVLRGFEEGLASGAIRAIQFEYGRINIRSRALLADFYALLEDHGYRIGKIYPSSVDFRAYSLKHEDFIGPNFLAVRRDDGVLSTLLRG